MPILPSITCPADVRELSKDQLAELATEIRQFIVDAVSQAGSGHLGSNLGAVELTLALHRVFDSPRDIILWDTGHQAYVHKILTGRRNDFGHLRQAGGLSGYPSRAESPHDLVENSQDLICIHDLKGKILSANSAAVRMLGYEMTEVLKISMSAS